jgi:hypothetical protein
VSLQQSKAWNNRGSPLRISRSLHQCTNRHNSRQIEALENKELPTNFARALPFAELFHVEQFAKPLGTEAGLVGR